jgi:hypothetical protein
VVGERIDELGRRAQRVLYIQVGVAATARDALLRNVQTISQPSKLVKELDQYERRGARALGRSERAVNRRRRDLQHEVRKVQRGVGRQTNGVRKDAEDIVDRVKRIA